MREQVIDLIYLSLACLSANKLTLSLRAYGEAPVAKMFNPSDPLPPSPRLRRRRSWVGTSTFEIRNPSTKFSASSGSTGGTGSTAVSRDNTLVEIDSFEMKRQNIHPMADVKDVDDFFSSDYRYQGV